MRKIEFLDIIRYYLTYQDVEKDIVEKIHNKNVEIRHKALAFYMNNHMKIGRCFRSGTDAMILWATKNHYTNSEIDVEELSDIYYRNDLLNNKIKNAKVAASKLLWLFNHDVVIMDKKNKRELKINSESYNEYKKAWLNLFEIKEVEISNVIIMFNLDKIDSIFNEKWFKMRVFDQYLWTLGNNQ